MQNECPVQRMTVYDEGQMRPKPPPPKQNQTRLLIKRYLVVFGIGHVFGFHSAVLRRLAGELHEEQQLFKDGRVHDLQVLRADTDGLRRGGKPQTNTADIHQRRRRHRHPSFGAAHFMCRGRNVMRDWKTRACC